MSARCCPTPSRGSRILPIARSTIRPAARGSRPSSITGWGSRRRNKARRRRADPADASSLFHVEAVEMTKRRKGARPDQHHQQDSDAADQDGRNGAEPGGHDAGTEIAKLIGGAGEERTYGIDATTHLVRRFELDQR